MTPDLCIHRKALKSLTWDICSLWLAVIFLCLTTCISQSKNLCIYWLVPYLFRAMPQRWEAISQAIGLIKLLNKAEIHQSYIVCFFQLTETRVFILLSVQFLSCVWLFATTWIAAHQASLSIINSQSLLKLMSIESVMPSNQLILCCPLLLLPSIFPSIRVFSNESFLRIRWPKDWSFSFSISPSNEYSGLISFRIDWFHLLAVQRTLKSLLQHHSSKASILQCSAFFIVQLSDPYMTTAKTIFYFTECLLYARLCPKSCVNIIWVNPHNISMR